MMNAAHAAFLASQPLDPILQNLINVSQTQPYQPTLASQSKELLKQTPVEVDDTGRIANEGLQESVCEEVFCSYVHREIVAGCKPHPGDIVEAGPLAALSLPEEYYPICDSLPPEIIQCGKLSSLQLEGVIHACQRHQVLLPNGQRAGFFIGDGAGVGKGRQVAGIIFDNFVRGRTKNIWFTISTDLIVDSRRDLNDLGCFVKVIDGCQELDRETRVLGLPSDFKEGVVFSTYATLVSSVTRGGAMSTSRQSRLQQLIDWCGGDKFDGCLIFDECHKAKNFVPGKETASTKIALAVTTIQRMLPKARVVYCSATGVTDVKNMAFMERLGLWGEGASFNSFERFIESVQKKGLGIAEMLAMEMKTTGMYVSRGLSFKQAEFVTIEAVLDKKQKLMYDTAAHVWNELRKSLESAIVRTGLNNNRIWAQFWSAHQRFFKQLCMGMKVPTIVKEAKEGLEKGYSIVIGLQTTGEASLVSELNRSKGSITGFVSLCREILTSFIQNYFPTKFEKPPEDGPLEDSWSVTAYNMLLDFSKRIKLPNSPLDEIIDQLGGPSEVAEMTGRKGRIVRRSSNSQPQYEQRGAESDVGVESLNVKERNMFMEGKKYVAIISDAASTGISLHADMRIANQKRRIHLTVELPWSADKAVQQLGRSHRSNQSSGPLYKLLTTDLGGERRFAAAVAKRLQSLGALTKGDRRAATGADLTEFNFDTQYGRSALRTLYNCVCQKQIIPGVHLANVVKDEQKMAFEEFNNKMQECLVLMGLIEIDSLRSGSWVKDKDSGDVGKFLNRILGLKVEDQNMIFNYFTECMNVIISNAKKDGRYNEGMLDITATSVEMIGKPKEVFKDLSKGHGTTKSVQLKVDRGMCWETALRRHQSAGEAGSFYVSKRDMWGRKMYILATKKDNSSHLYTICRPNTGLSTFDEEKSDLLRKYSPISLETAEKGWKDMYESSGEGCMHGDTCRQNACSVGSRCYKLHLICGNIVTLMSILESTLNRCAVKYGLSKYESHIRVVRVELDSGERVVGVRYPELLISEVERALLEKNMAEKLLAQSALSQSQGMVTIQDPPPKLTSSKSIREEVAPVLQKCYKKATTPPVTIKNFFKSKPTPSSSIVSEEVPASSTSSTVTISYEEFTKDLTRNSDSSKEKSEIKGGNSSCTKSQTTESVTDSDKSNKKRSGGTLLSPSVKRQCKQETIFSTFAKQASKKETEKEIKCPICGLKFETGLSNDKINEHVDNCLIE